MLFLDTSTLSNTAIPHDLSVRAAILIAALGLDALIGDPRWLWGRIPHPVVLFGRAVEGFDKLFNRPRLVGFRLKGKVRRGLGVLSLLFLVGVAAAIGAGIATTTSTGEMVVSAPVELLLVAILLAGRSLADHAKAVANALENGSLKEARTAISMIVGRNSEKLDRTAIARAAIESTAENLSDGIIAPALFYLALGLPGIFAYKMINTADSMLGYRSARHFSFGWGSARLDDFANLVPARLTGLLIAIAGPNRTLPTIAVMRLDAPQHRSPNAGWPQAAMASQLNLSLAGPKLYGQRMSHDREVNQGATRKAGPVDINQAVSMIWRTIALIAFLATLLTLA